MNEKLNNKLEKIDKLLSDEREFEKYMEEVEHIEVSYSNNLEEKILLKVKDNKINDITKEKSKENNKKNNTNYFNILKMVACMILAIILCQTDYIKNTDFSKPVKVNQAVENKSTFIDEKVNQISNFLMKPINLEKGEK